MNSSPAPSSVAADGRSYHPTFLHARREAWIITGLWAVCLAWTVPYCYWNGYVAPSEVITSSGVPTIWGIPRWVFFGIAVPWLLVDVFTTWFCFWYMKDDDLGETNEGLGLEEDVEALQAEETNSEKTDVDARKEGEV